MSLLCNEPKEPKDKLDVGVEMGIDEEKNIEKSKVEVVNAPKSRMIFKYEHVIAYYKRYAKQTWE